MGKIIKKRVMWTFLWVCKNSLCPSAFLFLSVDLAGHLIDCFVTSRGYCRGLELVPFTLSITGVTFDLELLKLSEFLGNSFRNKFMTILNPV